MTSPATSHISILCSSSVELYSFILIMLLLMFFQPLAILKNNPPFLLFIIPHYHLFETFHYLSAKRRLFPSELPCRTSHIFCIVLHLFYFFCQFAKPMSYSSMYSPHCLTSLHSQQCLYPSTRYISVCLNKRSFMLFRCHAAGCVLF